MRLPFAASMALLGCLVVQGRAATAEPFRVRVLSYNIHHAEGTDGRLDLERIAKVVTSAEAGLVALQEVDYSTGRTGRVDQLAELAKRTGLTPVRGDNIDVENGRYGNAVLSRWPVVRHENHLLPVLTGGEQRGVLAVEVDPGQGRPPFTFLCTHLDHRAGDVERLAAAKVINELAASGDSPAVLAGDLNAVPDGEVLRAFGGRWENSTAEPLPTIPAGEPSRQIDYVLFRPAGRWRVVETKVIDEPIASDHRPLLAVLELRAD